MHPDFILSCDILFSVIVAVYKETMKILLICGQHNAQCITCQEVTILY